jgi:hypothetical protein
MITFVGMSGRSSGQIRGQQISHVLNADFIEKGSISETKQIFDHVIMVRSPSPINVIKAMQSTGAKVGFDLLDVPAGNFLVRGEEFNDMSSYIHGDAFDFYIVNNSHMKSLMHQISQKPCFVIPHHSVNFISERTCFGEKIERIGYLGLIDQIDNAHEIRDMAKSLGIDLVCADEVTPRGCVEFLDTLDAGIIFLEEESTEDETIEFLVGGSPRNVNKNKRASHLKRFKPNTKLTNFQSFGIPTICTEYESFREFGGQNYVSVKDLGDVQKALERLKNNIELRKKLSDSSYEHAKSFHIGEIAKKYREILL